MTSAVTVRKYSKEYAEIWNRVVRTSRNGTFIHERPFMDYHADRFEDSSSIVFNGAEPIGVFPANRAGDLVTSHAGLTFGGLLYGIEQRAVSVRDAISALFDYYRNDKVLRIRYKAVPHIFHRYPAEEDLHALFLHNAQLVRRDLSAAIVHACRPKLTSSRSSGVNKARRLGLRVVEGPFFDEFHTLLKEVLKRHEASPVHSSAELALLQSRFPERISLIGVFDADVLLAGSWLFHFDRVTHFQYLACSDTGRHIGALDFLIAHVIETPRPGIEILSFGASTEQGGRYLNEGLMFQKEGFGARGVVLDHYEVEL